MKFGIKLTDITIGQIQVGGIEVNTDLSISEMIAIRKESEIVLKKMPEYLEDLAEAATKFEEIEERMYADLESKAFERSVIEEIKNAILNDINAVG